MPYKSDAQRRYFNANRAQLEAQGVDVDEWNDSSRGMKLPERAKKKKTEKSAIAMLAKLAAESEYTEAPPNINRLSGTGVAGYVVPRVYQKLLSSYAGNVIGKPDSRFVHTPPFPAPSNSSLQGLLKAYTNWMTPRDKTVGAPINSTAFQRQYSHHYDPKKLEQYKKIFKLYGKDAPNLTPFDHIRPSGASYRPDHHIVTLNPAIKDNAGHILAHELGHAKQRRFLQNKLVNTGRRVGGLLTAYGGFAPLFRQDPEAAKRDALLGTAGMLPTLGLEFDASLRGSNLMKQLARQEGTWSNMKLFDKLKHRLGAFKGFPTYLAAATLPLATYGTMKGLGAYHKTPQQVADARPSFGKQIQKLVNNVREQLK